ncbi:sensor histidine kinase [Streptomyces sp. SP18BB07]|uniref:sensor histidine kinase n=1 Tax=Streptomyces sp. SP18BB07 TaxID=3002522 RepID=UPI002E7A39C1|nr:histidine kinase [Streptomyces sp. SP18BB07]MEE1758251.1 histidine kinase [Streptomyces sp. SP18BB07]
MAQPVLGGRTTAAAPPSADPTRAPAAPHGAVLHGSVPSPAEPEDHLYVQASRPAPTADVFTRWALDRPGTAYALIVAVVQGLCVLAVLLNPVAGASPVRGWSVVAVSVLCAGLAAQGVRRSPLPPALLAAVATALALAWVLTPGELAYVAVSTGVAAAGGRALRHFRTELAACELRARTERQRLAEEHRRLHRDLHDLVGYSLSAVVVQAEVLDRRLAQERGADRPEVAELLCLTRRALAEIRTVSAGPRQLVLARELVSVQRILSAAEVKTVIEGLSPAMADPHAEAALAAVLREGTTNLLRHSRARSCRITLREEGGRVTLRLSNDGYESGAGTGAGTGLRNLADRVAAVGGTLTWAHGDNWFSLQAECPVRCR